VGANVGLYAKMLREALNFKGIILSLEPNPSSLAKLLDVSNHDPLWFVYEYALSNAEGQQQLNVMIGSQFFSFSKPRHT